MISFLQNTELLNHIDLSGMNLGAKNLTMICENLYVSPSLLAIHLSDNGIIQVDGVQLLVTICDIFGVDYGSKWSDTSKMRSDANEVL